MQHNPKDAYDQKMRRIVYIEKPLHALPLTSLPIIAGKDRDRQKGKDLQKPVSSVKKQEVYRRIEEAPEHDIPCLSPEVLPVDIEIERTHDRYARPV